MLRICDKAIITQGWIRVKVKLLQKRGSDMKGSLHIGLKRRRFLLSVTASTLVIRLCLDPSASARNVIGKVEQAPRVPVFIVIPHEHLDNPVHDDPGGVGVHNARMLVPDDISGY